jgi:D-alanyl-lipoteichoic acid acyltransferase DltB (MBOAT superfamily)
MVFSSFQFLFVFLPVFMLAYVLVPATRWRNYLILAFSLAFYVWGEKGYVSDSCSKEPVRELRANACWRSGSSATC